jgi:hypothetical protein
LHFSDFSDNLFIILLGNPIFYAHFLKKTKTKQKQNKKENPPPIFQLLLRFHLLQSLPFLLQHPGRHSKLRTGTLKLMLGDQDVCIGVVDVVLQRVGAHLEGSDVAALLVHPELPCSLLVPDIPRPTFHSINLHPHLDVFIVLVFLDSL